MQENIFVENSIIYNSSINYNNPFLYREYKDIDTKKLELCKKNKVNRISVGVESFDKNNLEFLGRRTDINIEDKIKSYIIINI